MWRPLFSRRDRHTSPTTQINLPPGTSTRIAVTPYLAEAAKELVIILDMPKLPFGIAILLHVQYGGEVTTKCTDLSGIARIPRASMLNK